ncbi:Uncharacterised protein [Vibrio cholerae]|uniref:Uncharacterized protein n=1 Tax=Vibrio cholerae TaxID=666 RepID=A0A655QTZ8_VIBCL|nr:Uncharacterised protein [Vibrio cholerae]
MVSISCVPQTRSASSSTASSAMRTQYAKMLTNTHGNLKPLVASPSYCFYSVLSCFVP